MKRHVLLLIMLLAAGGMHCGCGSQAPRQNQVIGQGPNSLTFVNRGSDVVNVRVTWARDDGGLRTRSFDLQNGGTVELRLVERVEYEIGLDAACSCPTPSPTPAVPQHEVVVVGGD